MTPQQMIIFVSLAISLTHTGFSLSEKRMLILTGTTSNYSIQLFRLIKIREQP